MKRTENNEIDLLLRSLARREGASSVASEDESALHLDADELNSYAEQTLPAATRARYTTHLAECASCRKIVSDLTSASGAHVSEHSVSPTTSSFREKVAAFFSPSVLRYAVPALALFAFIAVGLVALRQQTQPDLVAVNEPAASSDARLETKQANSPATSEERAAVNEQEGFHDSQTSVGKDQAKDSLAKSADAPETSTKPSTADSVSVTADRDASAARPGAAVAQPSYAPEPAAPPPPKTVSESPREVDERQKKEADKNEEPPAREQEGGRARRNDSQNQAAVTAAKRSPSVQRDETMRTPEAKLASAAGAKAKDDEAETRTVSGRRFRRQGSTWIDTAFQSSSATTIVTRGSEQFRALVADEPGIRAIAAQLPGEVVVVWKGRAYRIR